MSDERDEIFERYIEEIFKLIDRGFWRTPILSKGWLYLYNDLDESERINLQIFTPTEQKEIQRQAREYAKRKREEVKQEYEKAEAEETGTEEKKKRGRPQGSTTVGIGRKYTVEQLDKSHAKIVRNLTEATGWFADVLHEIGFYATIIAMQHAKVPPDELYEQVVKFKDPAEFSAYVKDHLAALLEATEDAQILMDLRRQLDIMDAKLLLLQEAYQRLKGQRDELTLMVHTATASMCDACMKRFILSWMSVKYGLSVRLDQMGGVEDGRTISEGFGEEEGDTGGRSEALA